MTKKENDLFINDFPMVNSDEELEELSLQYPKYDPYYIASGSIKDRKEYFEKLWKIYRNYADKHFLKEVKTNFHQRSWEMYLSNLFIENGFEISSKDKGPDIKIDLGDRNLWIECVASKKGEKSDKVPDMMYEVVQDVPADKMLLRITNSIDKKFKKYQKYVKDSIIKKGDYYIIAVNAGGFGYIVDTDMPLILKCLISIGFWSYKKLEDGSFSKPFLSRREYIEKQNKKKVKMNYFEDKKYNGISGVIYTPNNVLNLRDKDDCIFISNPLAKNELPKSYLPFIREVKITKDKIIF